jgi:monofunctional glycosyltransferase
MALSRRRKNARMAVLGKGALFLRWTFRFVLLLLVADLFYLAVIWPNWSQLTSGAVPKSNFIQDYELRRSQDRSLPALRWRPVPLSSIPRHTVRAVILAEDSRFYQHNGFDLAAFREAMTYNWGEGKLALGASTISQQTVKNLYLSPARTPWRKWHELVLTWGMEQHVSKRRILEIYLNIAEFGPGIYGVQAAAEVYYGVPASDLSVLQAAELAATLPSPLKHNPKTRTVQFQRRTQKIMGFLARHPGDAAEAVGQYLASIAAPIPATAEPMPESDDVADTI